MAFVFFPEMKMHVRLLTINDLVDVGMTNRFAFVKPDNIEKLLLLHRQTQFSMYQFDPVFGRRELASIHSHELMKLGCAIVEVSHDGLGVLGFHFSHGDHITLVAVYVIYGTGREVKSVKAGFTYIKKWQ